MVIVYASNTGFTQQYAKMLSEELGIPAYHIQNPQKAYKGQDAIFLGWVMAGSIVGYKKAAGDCNVKYVVAVGMSPEEEGASDKFRAKMNVPSNVPVLYLQGGYDYKKLKGVHKVAMSVVEKAIDKRLAALPEEERFANPTYKMIHGGYSVVSKDKLAPVVAWAKEKA